MEKRLKVDDRKEAYGSFFVDDFAIRSCEIADNKPLLQEAIFDLVADWRCASYAGALPAQIPAAIKGFHDSFTKADFEPSGILQFSSAILTKLSREVLDLTHDPALQRSIQESLVRIACELADAKKVAAKQEMDGDLVWQQYLDLHPFHMGLHSTMRLVYLAVYSAYENFVIRLVALANNGEKTRVNSGDFSQRFRNKFGKLVDDAWFKPEIRVAKLIRHSLMHAGGRMTDDLNNCNVQVPVEVCDGALHVYPEHIKKLYDVLKVQALRLMSAPCF